MKSNSNIKIKFIFASISQAIILCTLVMITSYFSYRESIINQYRENITDLVHTAVAYIPKDKITKYYETNTTDSDFDSMIEQFKLLQKSNHLEYLYSYVPTKEGLKVFAQGTEMGDPGHFILGDVVGLDYFPQEDIDSANKLFADPNAPKIVVTHESKFGYLITAFEVIYDENHQPLLVVGADMSMRTINLTLRSYFIIASFISLLFIIMFICLYLFFLNKSFIDPLQDIVDSATQFVNTNRNANTSAEIPPESNELQHLSSVFKKLINAIKKE